MPERVNANGPSVQKQWRISGWTARAPWVRAGNRALGKRERLSATDVELRRDPRILYATTRGEHAVRHGLRRAPEARATERRLPAADAGPEGGNGCSFASLSRYAIVPGGLRGRTPTNGKRRTFMRFPHPVCCRDRRDAVRRHSRHGEPCADGSPLKLHHFVPAQANQQKFWFEPWAKKLEQESGGKLKVEIYPSMQLGGRQPQLLRSGQRWRASTSCGRSQARRPVGFPRLEVFELPFSVARDRGERPRRRSGNSTKTFAKDELKDVKPLAVWGLRQRRPVQQGRRRSRRRPTPRG